MPKTKKAVVPRLRFPEFRDAGPWEVKRLGEICRITNGSSNAQDHTEGGSYPLFDRSEVIKRSRRYLFDCEAVIIPGEGADFTPRYYVGKFDLHQRAYALMAFKAEARFIGHQIAAFKKRLAAQAVSSTVLSLRMPILERFPVLLPSRAEQQKIADCLSSLDEVIELEAKRLDALKDHKKGLLQQLFPREGETTPRLRFPEFRDAGPWEVKRGDALFRQISNKQHDGTLPVLAITQEYGAIPRDLIDYHVSVTKESIQSYKVVEIGDFIISLRTFQGGIEYSYYRGICSPAYIVLRRSDARVVNDFFRHFFKTKRYISALNRNIEGLRDGKMVSFKQFGEILLPLPKPDEQQKVADCLSSLDELIALEAKRLEALKAHKKGLMQQLFPQEVA